jgi:hypothetical protein
MIRRPPSSTGKLIVAKSTKTPRHRQPISKEFASIARDAERELRRDLTAKWRELRRIGVYNTKETAAQSRLTKARIRAINKHFKEIQRNGKSVGGRVERPIVLQTTLTKKGNIRTRYKTSGHFEFIRTKQKTELRSGITKTRKGYIIEKTSKQAKVRLNKRGQVVESVGGVQRRLVLYKGKDMMQLLDDMEKGRYKLEPGEMIVLKKWGSPNATISVDDETGAVLLGGYWSGFLKDQPRAVTESFINHSVIEIIRKK